MIFFIIINRNRYEIDYSTIHKKRKVKLLIMSIYTTKTELYNKNEDEIDITSKKGVSMEQKIIFLDIDGTLTEPGKNVPPESALEAIRRAREKGHTVFLCTGRNYDMLKPLLAYEFDGFIASAGGYIRCGDDTIYDCPMTEVQRTTALEVFERNGIFRTVECRDGSYTDEGFKEFLRKHALESGNSEFLRWREQIEKSLNIRPMCDYRGQAVYKMILMIDDETKLKEPMEVLGEAFNFCIQEKNEQGFINCELVNKKFDKGQAVERVCQHLGILPSNTYAFGDSMNDLEMLEIAGTSICMENGCEQLKKVADDICPSVTKNGLYQAFEKYGLL